MKHQQSASSKPHEPAAKRAHRAARKGAEVGQPSGLPTGGGREQIIRQTAYAFYEARGCLDGHELEDWLNAEAQFEQESAGDPKASPSPGH
jgi:Protein of unknown function (DUF2934)